MSIGLKRAYERPSATDGARVLVDRLWPRGLKKTDAHISAWLRDLAPSTELRKWFGHREGYFSAFRKRYLKELAKPAASDALEQLYSLAEEGNVTLLYAAKDGVHNNAAVLKELLEGMRKPPTSSGPAREVAARGRGRMPRR
jgi:uncharacterized protein YeaO (DUF488 family)